MSDSYFRVKKWRELNKKTKVLINQTNSGDNEQSLSDQNIISCASKSNDSSDINPCDSQVYKNDFDISDNSNFDSFSESNINIYNDDLHSSNVSNNLFEQNNEEVMSNKTLTEKLRSWTLDNINILNLNVVTQLLKILREEGHEDLPKTSQQLLNTKHCRPMTSVLSKRETNGSYIYIGIKNVLQKIISPDIYKEEIISVQIHIDGISIYNNSLIQVWPIVLKVNNPNYETKPVVVALYCGDSKPKSANDYLKDLVEEANIFISDGIILNETKYSFKISCIIADSPARAFIKSVKNANGFFACERCTIEGITVNHKRVYPCMHCDLRTKKSFKKKKQAEHHLENTTSELVKLKQFDPVRDIVLDSMHTLYLGAMKNLLEKLLIIKKHPARLKSSKVKILRKTMESISADIPVEFERKFFDIDQVSKWKATQFRFFLLYIGPLAFKNVLSDNKFRHFLLLFVSCRILNDLNAFNHVDYAQDQVRLFFKLLPSEYGEDAQVLSMHNLIHVPDDVRHFQLPLSEISAFWGENYISLFKHLVKSPYKPLTQIANRLNELESADHVKIKNKSNLCECTYGTVIDLIEYHQKQYFKIEKVKLHGIILSCKHPNNIIQLYDDKILLIDSILSIENDCSIQTNIGNLFIYGILENERREVFDYPTSSIDIGVLEIISWKKQKILLKIARVKRKCILFNLNDSTFVMTLLHI